MHAGQLKHWVHQKHKHQLRQVHLHKLRFHIIFKGDHLYISYAGKQGIQEYMRHFQVYPWNKLAYHLGALPEKVEQELQHLTFGSIEYPKKNTAKYPLEINWNRYQYGNTSFTEKELKKLEDHLINTLLECHQQLQNQYQTQRRKLQQENHEQRNPTQ